MLLDKHPRSERLVVSFDHGVNELSPIESVELGRREGTYSHETISVLDGRHGRDHVLRFTSQREKSEGEDILGRISSP